MKLFQYSGNCHLNKVQRASTHPSISLIVFILATILILPSFASAEVKKEYYPTGELQHERTYVGGVREGISKEYYKNGKLKAERNYVNGKQEGVNKIYYKSGNIDAKFNYKNGKLEGI